MLISRDFMIHALHGSAILEGFMHTQHETPSDILQFDLDDDRAPGGLWLRSMTHTVGRLNKNSGFHESLQLVACWPGWMLCFIKIAG